MAENEFLQFVRSITALSKNLPLFHTSDVLALSKISKEDTIRTTKCNNFGEDLVYCFYGRPAYRPNSSVGPDTLQYHLPVCFIIKSAKLGKAARLHPFDSGGFSHYKSKLHRSMSVRDFELPGDFNLARRIIKHFFKTERDYFWGYCRENLPTKPNLPYVSAYCAIISAQGQGDVDGRHCSIEVQFDKSIAIKGNVGALILPAVLLDPPETKNWLKINRIRPLSYPVPKGCRPSDCANQILERAELYLKDEKII